MDELCRDLPDLSAWSEGEREGLLEGNRGVVVFHSGGPDSTALLHVFARFAKREKKVKVAVFHLNYGLRGEASDGDERFSRALSAELGLPWSGRLVTDAERAQRRGGVQAWARQLRLAEVRRLAADGWVIALGHHLDDLAETVLLRLARGGRPERLCAMRVWRPPLWRPLLGVRKAELRAALEMAGLGWREDASNAQPVYARNVIRNEVLPRLEQLYPGAAERMVACARAAAELGAARAAAEGRAGARPPPEESPGFFSSTTPRTPAPPPKAQRTAQHARSLAGPPRAALLEPGSYALFRAKRGHFAMGRDFPSQDEPLWPFHAKVYGAGASALVRFPGCPRAVELKALLRSWAVPPASRGQFFLVELDGDVTGLFDGEAVVRPGPQWEKTAASQRRLNLRYLEGELF